MNDSARRSPPGIPSSCQSGSEGGVQRSLEAVHRDVDFANRYRLELIKHTMSLAAAVFVFTITFMKDVIGDDKAVFFWALGVAWISMIVSLLGGMLHMFSWDRFYSSYRDHDARDRVYRGKIVRGRINILRYIAMLLQFGGFGSGLVFMVLFCLKNF